MECESDTRLEALRVESLTALLNESSSRDWREKSADEFVVDEIVSQSDML